MPTIQRSVLGSLPAVCSECKQTLVISWRARVAAFETAMLEQGWGYSAA